MRQHGSIPREEPIFQVNDVSVAVRHIWEMYAVGKHFQRTGLIPRNKDVLEAELAKLPNNLPYDPPMIPMLACLFLQTKGVIKGTRTRNFNCSNPESCTDDDCCVTELAVAYSRQLITAMKRAARAHQLFLWEQTLADPRVASMHKTRAKAQRMGGRAESQSPLWFVNDINALFDHFVCMLAEDDLRIDDRLNILMKVMAISLCLSAGQRAGNLFDMLREGVMSSGDPLDPSSMKFLFKIVSEKSRPDITVASFSSRGKWSANELPPVITDPVYWILQCMWTVNEYVDYKHQKCAWFMPIFVMDGEYPVCKTNSKLKPTDKDYYCRLTTSSIDAWLKEQCALLAISPYLRIHGLRGSKTLILLKNNVPIQQVNKIMGWTKDSTSYQKYGRLLQLAEEIRPSRVIRDSIPHPENFTWTNFL